VGGNADFRRNTQSRHIKDTIHGAIFPIARREYGGLCRTDTTKHTWLIEKTN
jgi:hypothetical protein